MNYLCCIRRLEGFWQSGKNFALQTTLLWMLSFSTCISHSRWGTCWGECLQQAHGRHRGLLTICFLYVSQHKRAEVSILSEGKYSHSPHQDASWFLFCLKTMSINRHSSESRSGEGTTDIPRFDITYYDDYPRCRDNSSNYLIINFCNILSLHSNFHSVKHHFFSSKPHIIFLNETHVSAATCCGLDSAHS